MLQSLTDESVANLSSIVLLAERDGRTALLTGDARSDFVVKGLEEIGLIAPAAASRSTCSRCRTTAATGTSTRTS